MEGSDRQLTLERDVTPHVLLGSTTLVPSSPHHSKRSHKHPQLDVSRSQPLDGYEVDNLIFEVFSGAFACIPRGNFEKVKKKFASRNKVAKHYKDIEIALDLIHQSAIVMFRGLKTYEDVRKGFEDSKRICVPKSYLRQIHNRLQGQSDVVLKHLEHAGTWLVKGPYSSLNLTDFVKKFNEDGADRDEKIHEAMRRLHIIKHSVWIYKDNAPQALKIDNISSTRLDLLTLFECRYQKVQHAALMYLIEILDGDPFTIETSNDLTELQKNIDNKIGTEIVSNNDTSLQDLLIRCQAIIIEHRNIHMNDGTLSAVADEFKQKTREAEKGFSGLATKAMKKQEREYWSDYAEQGAIRIMSDVSKGEEWLTRIARLSRGGLSIAAAAASAAGFGDVGNIPDLLTQAFNDLSSAFKNLEWKDKTYEIMLRIRKLFHATKNDPVYFRELVKRIQVIKYQRSHDEDELSEETRPKILYGIIATLESVILWSHNHEVQEEAIKLLIQLMTIDNPSLQYRGIIALEQIINSKGNISRTAEVVLNILHASGFYTNKYEEIKGVLERCYTNTMPLIKKRQNTRLQQAAQLQQVSQKKSELPEGDFYAGTVRSILRRLGEVKVEIPGVPSPATLLAQSREDKITHSLFKCLNGYPELMGPDNYGNTAFVVAALKKNSKMIECLRLNTDVDINQPNFRKETALLIAVQQMDLPTVNSLLQPLHQPHDSIAKPEEPNKHPADPNKCNENGDTPLHLIAKYPIDENNPKTTELCILITRALLRAGAKTDITNDQGQTPLNCALALNNVYLMEILFVAGAEVMERVFNLTPFIVAARQNSESCMARILELKDGKLNPHECLELLRFFDRYKSDLNRSELAQLHLRYSNSKEFYKIMFSKFKDWPFIDREPGGKIVLTKPKKDSVQELLHSERKSLVRTESINILGTGENTVMHYAKRSLTIDKLRNALRSKEVNVNSQNDLGLTAASIGVICNNEKGLEEILALNPQLNLADINGNTPLHFAAFIRNSRILMMLLKAGADPTKRNNYGDTPLLIYIGNDPTHTLDTMKYVTTHAHFLNEENNDEPDAIAKNTIAVIEKMVAINPNVVQQTDALGNNALHRAFLFGSQEILIFLLSLNAFRDLFWFYNSKNELPVQVALKTDAAIKIRDFLSTFTVDYFLELRENFKEKTKNKITFEGLLAVSNLSEVLEKILEKNRDIACHPDSSPQSNTPLHYAAKMNFAEIAALYKKMNLRGDARNKIGDTPAHIAASEGNTLFVKTLLACEFPCNVKNFDKRVPLHYAAAFGHKEIVEVLVEKYKDVLVRDCHGDLPIHLAAKHGHTVIVDYLAKAAGDSVHAINDEEQTPLHVATANGYQETVELLLTLGANVEAPNIWGETPLFYSILLNNGLIDVLLNKGQANTRALNSDGETPLHAACFTGNLYAVERLLKRDIEIPTPKKVPLVNIEDMSRELPLHELTKVQEKNQTQISNIVAILDILLRNNILPDTKTYRGEAFIHLVCFKGMKELLIKFLKHFTGIKKFKADFLILNKKEQNALHCACIGNQLEIVQILKIYNIFPVDNVDSDGMTPLNLCLKAGFAAIAEYLLMYHADVSIVDKLSRNCLHHILGNEKLSPEMLQLFKNIVTKHPSLLYCQDSSNNTVFHLMAKNNHIEAFNIAMQFLQGSSEQKRNLLSSYNREEKSPYDICKTKGHSVLNQLITAKYSSMHTPTPSMVSLIDHVTVKDKRRSKEIHKWPE
jgi:ankyrin repeat protein